MAWAVPKFPRDKINWAGKVLVREANAEDMYWTDNGRTLDWLQATAILNNWRSSHGYPLNTFQINLRKSARAIYGHADIAQRTKRLISISNKLARFPSMKLSQMQDIGGCRAVLETVDDVKQLSDFYKNKSRIKHKLASCDDYIASPQKSGYRGIHLVYRYVSDKSGTKKYNDLKIEIQLRSQYQHAWATAVETVGTFIRQALKSSIGEKDWLRFFALMGTAIAHKESSPIVPETPKSRNELKSELDHYTEILSVLPRLQSYGYALKQIAEGASNAHYYLLRLSPTKGELIIKGFKLNEIADAEIEYAEAEKYVKEHPETDAVLVAVDSIASLQRAYPNYFADTRVFSTLVQSSISGAQRKLFKSGIAS